MGNSDLNRRKQNTSCRPRPTRSGKTHTHERGSDFHFSGPKPSLAKATTSNYEVGYGRPPKHSQFKKGQSGNPRGRPRGSRNLATDLSAELGEKVTVREHGHSRTVSKQRALIKSLTQKAMNGDVRAIAAVLALYSRVITEPPPDENQPVDADELQIVRRFAPGLLRKIKQQ